MRRYASCYVRHTQQRQPRPGSTRKQRIAVYDGSGLLKTDSFDFKGNLLSSTKRLADSWTSAVYWGSLYGLTDPATIESTAGALLEAETFTETREYDALNRVTLATSPDLSETMPTYNEAGLLESVEVDVAGSGTPSPVIDDIDYDAKGQRVYVEYGNGTHTTYTYDPLTFRLARALTKRTSDNATLQDLTYTYDPVGNVVEIGDAAQQTVFFDNTVVDATQRFEYDPTYRLVRAEGREHASLDTRPNDVDFVSSINIPHANMSTALRNYVEEFTYDEVGNFETHEHTPIGSGTAWTRSYAYVSGKNQLASTNTIETYTYDAYEHGNITSMPHLSAITWSSYDQMVSANLGGGGMVYFTYDTAGQRVRKVREHVGGAIVEERIYLGSYEIYRKRVSGVIELERQTLHLMDGVKRVAMVEAKTVDASAVIPSPTPRWRFQLDNHLGSACLEVDDVGDVISYEEYHAYGTTAYQATKSGVDVSAKRYRYTGKERDEETGFYYHGARYYAAWLGRWVSADPLGIQAGLNLYLYGRASPVVFTDPSGLDGQNMVRDPVTGKLPNDPLLSTGGGGADSGQQTFDAMGGFELPADQAREGAANYVKLGAAWAGAANPTIGLVLGLFTTAQAGSEEELGLTPLAAIPNVSQALKAAEVIDPATDLVSVAARKLGNVTHDAAVDLSFSLLTSGGTGGGDGAGKLLRRARNPDGTFAKTPAEAEPLELRPYEVGRGHHLPAKKAFEGAKQYDERTALAVPKATLDELGEGIHGTITGSQASQYSAFSKTEETLTWSIAARIETNALVSAGIRRDVAQATVDAAIAALKEAGVERPVKIPWSRR